MASYNGDSSDVERRSLISSNKRSGGQGNKQQRIPPPIEEWRKYMWPLYLCGILVMVLEYVCVTIFITDLGDITAGVTIATIVFVFTIISCVRCLCQRQGVHTRWLTWVAIVVVVTSMAAALATGIVGSYYWMQYKLVSKGNTYTDVATTALPADLDDASILYFETGAYINTADASSTTNTGVHSCVAPVVSSASQDSISFVAVIVDNTCCGTSSIAATYACPGWLNTDWAAIVRQSTSSDIQTAASTMASTYGLTLTANVMYVDWVESPSAIQQARLIKILLLYLIPAALVLLWLPLWYAFYYCCGCCAWCDRVTYAPSTPRSSAATTTQPAP